MSLLLDALKRAEQAKQTKQADSPAETNAGQSAPSALGETNQPDLDSGLALEEIKPAIRQSQPTNEIADRDAVRNVFAAKQSVVTRTSSQPKWLLPLIAVVSVVVIGGGWFVWQEIAKLTPKSNVISAPPAPRPVMSAEPVTPSAPAAQQEKPVTAIVQEPPAPEKGSKVPLPDSVSGSRSALSASEKAREDLARSLRRDAASKDAPLTLRMSKGIEPPKVSEELAAAYTALKAANFAEAKRKYATLVSADGNNLDARLGLATALARSNETAAALREYRKALEIDPRNSTALAAMLVLADAGSLPKLETDIRTLISRFPDSAALAFALGNVLSSQSRWTEAQQAYFDAWRLEPENSDYAFNLAVSLDQIRQGKLALEYYQTAVKLAERFGSQFDRRQVERRIAELSSASPQ